MVEMSEEDSLEDDLRDFFGVPKDYVLPPRECCGAPDDTSLDFPVYCKYADCVTLYCRCGRDTGSGWGLVNCPCRVDDSSHLRTFEMKMLTVKNVALPSIKKKARRRRG